MKHLKLIFACLLTAIFSIGQVWGAEQVAYTLTPATGSNNGYASACDVTISGITWNVTGNATLTPWRLGGKSLSGVDRTVFSKTAMGNAITKVELTVGAASGIAVNSLKLIVAYNADFSTVVDEVTETFTANSTITFTPTSPLTEWATGAYYKFVFNVTVTGTNNKFVAFSEAKFYKEVATETCETPTFSPAAGTFYGSQEITLATTTTGASIYYTLDGTTPSSSNGTLYEDPFTITETKTVKAIAVKDGATDSGVAEATYTAGETVSSYTIDFETDNLVAYINWDFVNIKCATTTIAAHAGTYYGNTDGKASASITTKAKIATPGALTFWTSKESGNTTASSWIAQVSDDGDTWTDAGTFDATTGAKGDWTERTADLSAYTDVYVRIAYSGSTAIRAIDDISLSTTPSLLKPTITGVENFVNTTEVTISHATADAIYYTTNGDVPTTGSTLYSAPFELNATATVKAIAVKGGESSPVASKEFTKITPITVAEAIAAIPNADDVVDNQYVSGIVCTAGTSVNASGQMTYYISDDGSETSRLQIYLGKNLNNTAFSASSDLAIGDRVVVFGQLKNFKGTAEMNSGNYLVSKADPAVAAPAFTPNGGGFMGETDVTISCSTASSSIYYTLDGSAPSKSSTLYEGAIHLNATTTINAIAYVGDDASLVISKTFTLTAPMTVAAALTALDSENPINNVAVAGIISTAPSSNPSSGRLTYFISDDGSDTDELEVYLGFGLNGASFSAKTDLQVGDEVTVFGNLTIHNSTTKEFATGSRLLAFNRPEVAVTDIDLTESTAEVEVGSTVALHASVVPGNATDQDIVWSVTSGSDKASVDENGVVTGLEEGEATIRAAAHEDESIYAECTVTVNAASAPLTDYYQKATSVAEGTYLIVYEAGNVAFNGGLTTLDASSNTIAVEITSDNKIGVTPATEAATFYIDPTAGTIKSSSGRYIGRTANSNGLNASETEAYTNTISIDGDGNAVIVGSGSTATYLRYNPTSGQTRFRYFTANQQPIALYKLANEVIKPAAGLAWDPAEDITLIVGEAFTAPTLLNPNSIDASEITIESSNTDVATVSAGVVSLVENATGTTTITATYTGETYKPISVSYKIKVNPAYSIYVDKLNVNFGSVEKDAAVADKKISVTLTNVAAATLTLAGDGASAFSISPAAALTASGDITITASSAAEGTYAATITISDDASQAESKVVNLSLTVTEPAGEETAVSTTSKWVPATEIADGMQVLITGVKSDDVYAMGEQKNNNRAAVAASVDGEGVLTPGENTMAFTLVAQGDGTYALRTSNGKYLYAAASGNNYLKTQDEVDVNAKWTMTVASASAEGSSNRHVMQFNTGSTLFSCYASAGGSGMAAIKLYVPKPVTPPTPVYETVRSGLTVGNYYTICYPKAMTDVQGATLWSFVGKDTEFAYIEQETATTIEAGKPYIMYATASTVTAVLGDETNAPGANGAIHGTFSNLDQDQLNNLATVAGNDLYLVIGNELRRVTGYALDGITPLTGNSLPAQRAFVVVGDIPAAPANMPAHVRAMPMQGESAQGIENIGASEKPMKLMIDGQLFILRGEKMYDATGRMVK